MLVIGLTTVVSFRRRMNDEYVTRHHSSVECSVAISDCTTRHPRDSRSCLQHQQPINPPLNSDIHSLAKRWLRVK